MTTFSWKSVFSLGSENNQTGVWWAQRQECKVKFLNRSGGCYDNPNYLSDGYTYIPAFFAAAEASVRDRNSVGSLGLTWLYTAGMQLG